MLKYSKASLGIIKQELATISFFVALLSSFLMMVYLVYSTIVGNGIFVANIALCVITTINFVTYILMHRAEAKDVREARNWIKHTCRITKLGINAVSLATIVYAVVSTPDEVNAITLVLLPLMIIFWVLQAIVEMVTLYVKSRMDLFLAGIQMDFDYVLTPLAKVKNAVGSVMGEEPQEPTTVSPHNERLLKTRVEEDATRRKEKWKRRAKALLEHIPLRRTGAGKQEDTRERVKK